MKNFLTFFLLIACSQSLVAMDIDSFRETSEKPRSSISEKGNLLKEDLKKASDLTRYDHRPYDSTSREEAFDKLTIHCQSMMDYHEDMANFYQSKVKEFRLTRDEQRAAKRLTLFIKSILGFNLSKGVNLVQFIQGLKENHAAYQRIWASKVCGLTGDIFPVNGELIGSNNVLSPSAESSLTIITRLKKDMEEWIPQLNVIRQTPEKFVDSAIAKMGIDEAWALRHAYALIEKWARPDEEIQAEQIRKERNRKKRLMRNQKKNKEGTSSESKLPSPPEQPIEISEGIHKKAEGLESFSNSENLSPVPEKGEEIQTSTLYDGEDEEELRNYHQWEEDQRALSKIRKQAEKNNPPSTVEPIKDISKVTFDMDKDSYGYFMDLFENRQLNFNNFKKAFENGLGGKMYKNRGGSIRTFERGSFTFNLHKPHGKKGKAVFYDGLRTRTIKQLNRIGVNKDTIHIFKN